MKQRLIEEAAYIASQNEEGLLTKHDMVAFAANPDTALHGEFEWDNSKAGHKYRLVQAQRLIQVIITFEPNIQQNMRGWVSVLSNRIRPGGGYLRRETVLSSPELCAEMLNEALAELQRLKAKYQILTELVDVFAAIDAVGVKEEKRKQKENNSKNKKPTSNKKTNTAHAPL